jgi:acetolactate synthase-1/2/3 large subunit
MKWKMPLDRQRTVMQLDVNPERIGNNFDTAVGIVADAKLGIAALIEEVDRLLAGKPAGKVDLEQIARSRESRMMQFEELATSDEQPIRPERFLAELFRVLPDDPVICADPGTPCPYFAAYYQLPKPGRWFVSPRKHGALGYALPAVVGAYYAKPDAGRVIGVMGDGSFAMSAGDLETMVRLNLPVTLIVMNNASYGWIKAGQKFGHKQKYYAVDFTNSNHAAIAQAFGLRALRVEDPSELSSALKEGLTGDGPVLLDIVVQALQEAKAPVASWVV